VLLRAETFYQFCHVKAFAESPQVALDLGEVLDGLGLGNDVQISATGQR
jgi:hypothetical protein